MKAKSLAHSLFLCPSNAFLLDFCERIPHESDSSLGLVGYHVPGVMCAVQTRPLAKLKTSRYRMMQDLNFVFEVFEQCAYQTSKFFTSGILPRPPPPVPATPCANPWPLTSAFGASWTPPALRSMTCFRNIDSISLFCHL